jgi:hypothetical protein
MTPQESFNESFMKHKEDKFDRNWKGMGIEDNYKQKYNDLMKTHVQMNIENKDLMIKHKDLLIEYKDLLIEHIALVKDSLQ